MHSSQRVKKHRLYHIENVGANSVRPWPFALMQGSRAHTVRPYINVCGGS